MPVQFHVQLAYLGVQAFRVALWVNGLWAALHVKQLPGIFQQRLFPKADLLRVDTELLGDPVHRFVAFHRLQRHFRFLCAGHDRAFFFIFAYLFTIDTILNYCLFFGIHYSRLAKDFEVLAASAENVVRIAMVKITLEKCV